ncbi:MAG TPA: hypothetical protein VGK74_22910 [Symbiobacteriaceae bacterium]
MADNKNQQNATGAFADQAGATGTAQATGQAGATGTQGADVTAGGALAGRAASTENVGNRNPLDGTFAGGVPEPGE